MMTMLNVRSVQVPSVEVFWKLWVLSHIQCFVWHHEMSIIVELSNVGEVVSYRKRDKVQRTATNQNDHQQFRTPVISFDEQPDLLFLG
jgi:hypothetical protein